ncbi:MAG TPA: hypothetical protein VGK19_14940 [Capsulimonadaceae bacterium]|jgi:hypothetical protein
MPKSTKPAPSDAIDQQRASPSWERYAIGAIIIVALTLSSVPDILGWMMSGKGHTYVGYSYNIDDAYVYMSWAHQAADGHFFARNLFTTDHQLGRQFNLFFLAIGNLSRILHIPLVFMFFAVRVLGGAWLLWLIYRLYHWALPGSVRGRITAFALVALGAGAGWLYTTSGTAHNRVYLPVDTWQPEAITFLSLQFSSLFVVSTALIVACIGLLIRAEQRQSMRDAVYAGLCALILGNIHSYDIVHIAAAWAAYLLVSKSTLTATSFRLGFNRDGWKRALVAGAICVPTVLYQYLLYKYDPVFHARVENGTYTFGFNTYFLGYGLAFVFAYVAAFLTIRSSGFRSLWANPRAPLIFLGWAVAAFVIIYLPTSFQRKMIMGVHVPLCLLGGAALAYTSECITKRWKAIGATLLPLIVVLLSVPSNLVWIAREMHHLSRGDSETQSVTFLSADDTAVFDWIRDNTKPTDTFVGDPTKMLFVPGLTGRAVWCGHWGETPDYAGKFKQLGLLARGGMDDPHAFLKSTKTTYLVWPEGTNAFNPTPSYLKPVYGNPTYTIYEIR